MKRSTKKWMTFGIIIIAVMATKKQWEVKFAEIMAKVTKK
jgi:hypothetical protein